jgi:hypothetical protein
VVDLLHEPIRFQCVYGVYGIEFIFTTLCFEEHHG